MFKSSVIPRYSLYILAQHSVVSMDVIFHNVYFLTFVQPTYFPTHRPTYYLFTYLPTHLLT